MLPTLSLFPTWRIIPSQEVVDNHGYIVSPLRIGLFNNPFLTWPFYLWLINGGDPNH